ncbi:MAG: hypothetical protein J7K62_04135 [Thermoplasmata archaeon]|nr:hypothetical protein [Thermoplasmata archaeon]
MKKTLLPLIVILLFFPLFSGCIGDFKLPSLFGSEESKFVGTWKSKYNTITFFDDGTGAVSVILSNLKMYWEIKNGKLVITYAEGGDVDVYNYQFLDDNSLKLVNTANGITAIYQKVS